MSAIVLPLILERPFQVWSFSVTHSVLLLRSNRSPALTTRVDIMFRAVSALKLRNRYEMVSIDVVPTEELGPDLSFVGRIGDRVVFSLGDGLDVGGYVVAGSLFYSEDDLSYGEASTIDTKELEDHIVASGYYFVSQ